MRQKVSLLNLPFQEGWNHTLHTFESNRTLFCLLFSRKKRVWTCMDLLLIRHGNMRKSKESEVDSGRLFRTISLAWEAWGGGKGRQGKKSPSPLRGCQKRELQT